MSDYRNQMAAITNLLHTAVAPSGERYEVRAGVVCLQVGLKLCDPHLSALEVRFSR